jgi:hypothetical protein
MDRNLGISDILELLAGQRFELLELRVVRREQVLPGGEAVVDFAEASSFGNLTGLVPEGLRSRLRRELTEAFEAIRQAEGIVLHGHSALFTVERCGDNS